MRESGFYWVRREDGNPEVACWQTKEDSGLTTAQMSGWWLFAGVEDWKEGSLEAEVLSNRLSYGLPEKGTEWKSVSAEAPSDNDPVLVWHLGKVAVGRHTPEFPVRGMHSWLVFPMGKNPVAPYARYEPKWWMPLPEPPVGEETQSQDWGAPSEFGETVVRWRGSVGDLYTDLFPLLTPLQCRELAGRLIYTGGGALMSPDARLISNASSGKRESGTGVRGPGAGQNGEEVLERVRAALQRYGTPERKLLEVEAVVFGTDGASRRGPATVDLSGAKPLQPEPIAMILTCPMCSERHIDTGEFATKSHHTHACQFCGMPWRPAILPTVGVQFLPGFKNVPTADSKEQTANSSEKKRDA